jgi:uncharacterized protein (DUF1697 family)
MHTFIAFLRALNVGGRTVKMDRLRAHFTELGLADVATFIASGNVIFRAARMQDSEVAALEQRIEAHLEARLGFRTEAFIRSAPELGCIAAHRPFDAAGADMASSAAGPAGAADAAGAARASGAAGAVRAAGLAGDTLDPTIAAGTSESRDAHAPHESPAGDTLYVGFLRAAPEPAAHERLRGLGSGIDSFIVHDRELYWRCRGSISESPVTGPKLEKALGMPTTLRNITTVSKLAAKYGAPPAAGA